jgi:choline-sulfatase
LEVQHPAIRQLRHWLRNEEPYDDRLVRTALAGYYGLISFTDALIGQMLKVIDGSPLRNNTIVIYTSDHGEMGGHHGFWQKQCFYEPSVRIPLIVRAPGFPGGQRIGEHVSLVDILPTVLDLAHAELPDHLAGESLVGLLQGKASPDRPVFSEYHTLGSENAGYMVKVDNFKYVHYVGYEPQLFDVMQDPDEVNDLAGDPALQEVRDAMYAELCKVVDPIEVDRQAKANQAIQGIRRAFLKQ